MSAEASIVRTGSATEGSSIGGVGGYSAKTSTCHTGSAVPAASIGREGDVAAASSIGRTRGVSAASMYYTAAEVAVSLGRNLI